MTRTISVFSPTDWKFWQERKFLILFWLLNPLVSKADHYRKEQYKFIYVFFRNLNYYQSSADDSKLRIHFHPGDQCALKNKITPSFSSYCPAESLSGAACELAQPFYKHRRTCIINDGMAVLIQLIDVTFQCWL